MSGEGEHTREDLVSALIQYNKHLKKALNRSKRKRRQDKQDNAKALAEYMATLDVMNDDNKRLTQELMSTAQALQAANDERAETGRIYTNKIEELTLQNMWEKNRYLKEKASDASYKEEVLEALDATLNILEGRRSIMGDFMENERFQRALDASPHARQRIAELRAVYEYHSPPADQAQQADEPSDEPEPAVDMCSGCGTIPGICRCSEASNHE